MDLPSATELQRLADDDLERLNQALMAEKARIRDTQLLIKAELNHRRALDKWARMSDAERAAVMRHLQQTAEAGGRA